MKIQRMKNLQTHQGFGFKGTIWLALLLLSMASTVFAGQSKKADQPQDTPTKTLEVTRAERTYVYEVGGMSLSVEGKKDLVMLIVTIEGLSKKDTDAYVTNVANSNEKYDCSTNLWFPKINVQEDSYQLPPHIKTFRVHAGGQVSEPFTVADEINKLVKAGAGLR